MYNFILVCIICFIFVNDQLKLTNLNSNNKSEQKGLSFEQEVEYK